MNEERIKKLEILFFALDFLSEEFPMNNQTGYWTDENENENS